MRLFGRRRKPAVPKQVAIVDEALKASTPAEGNFADFYALVHDPAMSRFEAAIGYHDASAAFQDVMIKFWERWATMPPEQKTVAFAFKAIDRRVGAMRRGMQEDLGMTLSEEVEEDLLRAEQLDLPDVAVAYEGVEAQRVVDDAVSEFAGRMREAWVLSREGYSNREIAEVMGISESGVSQSLGRARKHLEKAMRRAGWDLPATSAKAALPRHTGDGSHV